MKKLTALIVALFLSLPLTAQAASSGPGQTGETVHIGVNGMVCDFCAQSLKKVFLKQGAADKVDISLEDKLITLQLKKDKSIDDATIKKLVTDAGYEVSNIHHMPAMPTKEATKR